MLQFPYLPDVYLLIESKEVNISCSLSYTALSKLDVIILLQVPYGVLERYSWLGLRVWISQRLVESSYVRFAYLLAQSRGQNAYYR